MSPVNHLLFSHTLISGYGMCSEVVAHEKPMIYVPRTGFVEEEGLLRLLHQHGYAIELEQQDFYQGKWHKQLDIAYKQGHVTIAKRVKIGNDGDLVAADKILELYSSILD